MPSTTVELQPLQELDRLLRSSALHRWPLPCSLSFLSPTALLPLPHRSPSSPPPLSFLSPTALLPLPHRSPLSFLSPTALLPLPHRAPSSPPPLSFLSPTALLPLPHCAPSSPPPLSFLSPTALLPLNKNLFISSWSYCPFRIFPAAQLTAIALNRARQLSFIASRCFRVFPEPGLVLRRKRSPYTISTNKLVDAPTHNRGHTRDLVITDSLSVSGLQVYDVGVSDHLAVTFEVPILVPPTKPKRHMTFRNIKNLDATSLSQHLQHLSPSPHSSADDLMDYYNTSLTSILDCLAPLKTRTVTFTRSAPWFTNELRGMKRSGRRVLERACKTSDLTVHKLAYRAHRRAYAKALSKASTSLDLPATPIAQTLSQLSPTTQQEVENLIRKSKTSTCHLDHLPSPLLKTHTNSISSLITKIINMSVETGNVPTSLKTALIKPLLKKPTLDPTPLSNYRPISNLPFISKLLEKVVSTQLHNNLKSNRLYDKFQSGFHPSHSTETALIRVTSDLLMASDSGSTSLLIFLDLSAAFDTVDHHILLHRLQHYTGLSGTALKWFHSYLTDRTEYVALGDVKSRPHTVTCGVPQGSVLGPTLFTIYMLPLGRVVSRHGVNFHCYADDTQLYLQVTPSSSPSATLPALVPAWRR
ncbi:unnamed protein product [Leuciscus chuanchicus]